MSDEESHALIVDGSRYYGEADQLNNFRLVKRHSPLRWWMLFLASAVGFINGIQNLQFAASEAHIVSFFNVPFTLGDLLTQAYYISFVLLAFPVIWIIMVKGLRFTVVCASGLALLGSVLSAISIVNKNLFSVALVSEFCAGFAQVFVLCIPSLLAGVWFANDELSKASATVVFIYQLASGMTLIGLPFIIRDEYVTDILGVPVVIFFSVVAGLALVTFLLVLCFFSDNPTGRHAVRSQEVTYWQSLRNLMSNPNFVLLFISYGVDYGIFSAMQSVFKAILAEGFQHISDATTGQIVACMMLSGTPAPLLFGSIIDRTKKFIFILLIIHAICILSAAVLVVAMHWRILWLVWVSIGSLGFGLTGKMSVGLETAAEMTYPEPEGSSSGLLVWSASVFTVLSVQLMRFLLSATSVVFVTVYVLACTAFACAQTWFMTSDLRRTRANYEVIEDVDS